MDEDAMDIIDIPVSEWLESVEFTSTLDVPVPENIVDQVIGQEDASIVVKKSRRTKKTCYDDWRSRYW